MSINLALFSLFLLGSVGAQQSCQCRCCIGQNCQSTIVGITDLNNCTTDACLRHCRCTYPQCFYNYPLGQSIGECSPPTQPTYRCQCNCCNTGTFSCIPTIVGYATATICDNSACSISCFSQFPGICVNDLNGRTQGICIGQLSTTSTITPITLPSAWLGNLCYCNFCQSTSACFSPVSLGFASAAQCSSAACTQACQARFTVNNCPLTTIPYVNQIAGTCAAESIGNIRCDCECCDRNSCLNYEIRRNGTCSNCQGHCQSSSPCSIGALVTSKCTINHSSPRQSFSLKDFILFSLLSSVYFK